MVAKLGVAADCSDYFKVKEISELLRTGPRDNGEYHEVCRLSELRRGAGVMGNRPVLAQAYMASFRVVENNYSSATTE